MTAYYNEIDTGMRPNSQSQDLTGRRVGALTVQSFKGYRGSPTRHAHWLCRCDCGGERIVRGTDLVREAKTSCAPCAKAAAAKRGANTRALPGGEAALRRVAGHYKGNAIRRGIAFLLSDQQVMVLLSSRCHYCGCPPALTAESKSKRSTASYNGIDRMDNAQGYTPENAVPCCHVCNYAKRDMPARDFLAWIERVHAHQAGGGR